MERIARTAAPGAVLRTRRVRVTQAGSPSSVEATQLLYVTTDEQGRRTVSVATVLQPMASNASSTHLVSYQEPYDGLGPECDPSYTLQLLALHETSVVPVPLQFTFDGDTVVTADYEGEDLAYGAGQQSGYETLDAIRAAEHWLGRPERSTPVGMVGYSGGSIATDFAAELAPSYAPQLDLVGVAEGGIPVDLFHNIAYVDHPGSEWNWVIPALFEGVARGFGLHDLDQYLTAKGIAAVNADRNQSAGGFVGLTTGQFLKPRYRDLEKVPAFVRIVDHLIMSRTGTPRGPLLIGVGSSDATGDGVMVTQDVRELAYTYCTRGVQVEFHVYDRLVHTQAGIGFLRAGGILHIATVPECTDSERLRGDRTRQLDCTHPHSSWVAGNVRYRGDQSKLRPLPIAGPGRILAVQRGVLISRSVKTIGGSQGLCVRSTLSSRPGLRQDDGSRSNRTAVRIPPIPAGSKSGTVSAAQSVKKRPTPAAFVYP